MVKSMRSIHDTLPDPFTHTPEASNGQCPLGKRSAQDFFITDNAMNQAAYKELWTLRVNHYRRMAPKAVEQLRDARKRYITFGQSP